MVDTNFQYDKIIALCRSIYEKKLQDYGAAWRILRLSSITDQIFIKANRIRTIQQKGSKKVNEDIGSEFIGIVNYSIMALIQLKMGVADHPDIDEKQALELFDKYAAAAKGLMERKNHDYGEAWRDMRISSLTDLILMKLLRIKQIEDNQGKTIISEGIDANYYDIINYSVFALIKLDERKKL
ncbi:MAG: DUF1599 domain-containing protein [Bacteroidetes bacterium]|nr:MAG: DUF1599 domain-containing protein [Bacteroidota bacterium]